MGGKHSKFFQRSGNPSPKGLGIQTALERQQSKTLRAQKKKWSKDLVSCSKEIMLDEKRVNRIGWNTKEMRMKRITLFFFFLGRKQGLDTSKFTGAALFSL